MSPVGALLTALLLPYADAAVPARRDALGVVEEFRFADAPPAVVRQALVEVPSVADSRPNSQPNAAWLASAAGRFDGRLCGAVNATYGGLRVDAICVPAEAAGPLARLLAEAFPGQDEMAVAEAWSGWSATDPLWTGTGRELPTSPDGARVVSVWWD